MENLGFYNGKFGPLDEMTVPFNDRVHFFGDGVYDATYTRNHKIYSLNEHIERFFNSASLLDINIPYSKSEIADILCDLVNRVDSPDQFVYWQVTRGTQIRNHTYPEGIMGNFWVVLKPVKVKDVYKKVDAITSPDTRFYHCNIKTLNLIPSVMYAQKAESLGMYETILYREGGRVTECSHANVHIINQNNVLQTAPTDNLILPGIARAHIIKACRELGIEVSETPFYLDDMMNAKEVLISSSGAFCMSCKSIDKKPVGGGAPDMLKRLQDYLVDDFMRATN